MTVNRLREKTYNSGSSRFEVFKSIDGERRYQDTLGGRKLSVGEEILLLQEYATRAREEWTSDFDNDPETEAMNMIRKIGGIATRTLEHYGAHPRRKK